MNELRLLIVDDENNSRHVMSVALKAWGYNCEQASNSSEALAFLNSSSFDVVFLELKLQDENGLDLVSRFLAVDPRLSIIVLTAFSSVDTAVQAIRSGATDYLSKPFEPDQIRHVLEQVKDQHRRLEKRAQELELMASRTEPSKDFISNETSVRKLFELTLKAAGSRATILILGESGTGKSQLARAVHKQSHGEKSLLSPLLAQASRKNYSRVNSLVMFVALLQGQSMTHGGR